jgi:hypothetical protein
MTGSSSERDEREADARLVERIARSYGPAPLDEAGRSRFDARLRERLEQRRRPALGPLVASLASVAVLALWAVARGPLAPGPAPVPVESAAAAAWEWELLLGGELESSEAIEAELPEDYAAIASVFLVP